MMDWEWGPLLPGKLRAYMYKHREGVVVTAGLSARLGSKCTCARLIECMGPSAPIRISTACKSIP